MTIEMPQLIQIRNGEVVKPTFSDMEMSSRLARLRKEMSRLRIDTAVFTSYHNICYYGDFLYCRFGRPYALVVDMNDMTTLTANIDGGQPWRRTFGSNNLVYTDWRKDNYIAGVKQLVKGKRVGIEEDNMDLITRRKFGDALPSAEFVDIAAPAMRLRMIKSQEEIAHITKMTVIADIGGAAVYEAVHPGVGEHEVALYSTQAMVREIANVWPHAELMDTWTWFQSGVNTDGAHNPVTSRRVQRGDILSLNCFPMVAGYYVALERTMFCQTVSDAHLRYWEINCRVHKEGKKLIKPGARCMDVANELNKIYQEHHILDRRTFGYGHSFGVLCHYYGREAGLEFREDVDTVLQPGMVVSMEPMIMIEEGKPGSGGYREHDIHVVTEDGSYCITNFGYGPKHNIIP
jgi:creatinase